MPARAAAAADGAGLIGGIVTQKTVNSWRQQWTCVGGTCAPPPEPARNAWERLLDVYTSFSAPVLRGCWAIPVATVVFFFSKALGANGLYVAGLYFVAYGVYCLSNFARCREAHCIVTGLGWSVLAAVAFVSAPLRLHWFGRIWAAFLVVAVLGHGFELAWAAARGTHILRA